MWAGRGRPRTRATPLRPTLVVVIAAAAAAAAAVLHLRRDFLGGPYRSSTSSLSPPGCAASTAGRHKMAFQVGRQAGGRGGRAPTKCIQFVLIRENGAHSECLETRIDDNTKKPIRLVKAPLWSKHYLPLPHSLFHSLTPSPPSSLTHSLTHSLTPSLTLTRSLTHSLTHPHDRLRGTGRSGSAAASVSLRRP